MSRFVVLLLLSFCFCCFWSFPTNISITDEDSDEDFDESEEDEDVYSNTENGYHDCNETDDDCVNEFYNLFNEMFENDVPDIGNDTRSFTKYNQSAPIRIDNTTMFNSSEYLWPNGIIPFRINKNFTKLQKKHIRDAISAIENASCVRFVKYNRREHEGYVYINMDNEDKHGCQSKVGKVGGRQDLYLAPKCFIFFHGVVLHELMHAVGFWHEHERPDAASYINISLAENGKESLKRRDYGYIQDSCEPYDPYSIMHYVMNPNMTIQIEWISNDTLEHPFVVGQRQWLTGFDKKKLNRMYNCNIDPSVTSQFNAQEMDAETRETLMLACNEGYDGPLRDVCMFLLAEMHYCPPQTDNK